MNPEILYSVGPQLAAPKTPVSFCNLRYVTRTQIGLPITILQSYVPGIAGYDDAGCAHYNGRGHWIDVPLVDKPEN